MPWRLRQPLAQLLLRITDGRPDRYGLPRARARPLPGPPDDLRHDPQPDQPRRDPAARRDRGARRRRRALRRRPAGPGRRDRLVHRLPRRAAVPGPGAHGAQPGGAAAVQAGLPPGRRRPVLRRADAVHRLGVPDRRAARRRSWPATCPGTGRRRRREEMARRQRPPPREGDQALGDRAAARRCGSTSTRSCTSSAASSTAARGGRDEPPRAGHRRQRRLRHRAAQRAALPRVGRSRGWTCAPDPDDPAVLGCDITDEAAVPAAVAAAVEQLGGGLDALINNAGIGGPASAGEAARRARAPDARRQRARRLERDGGGDRRSSSRRRGRVVIIGSRMAFIGLPLGAAYGVSKRARHRVCRRAARRVRHARRA